MTENIVQDPPPKKETPPENTWVELGKTLITAVILAIGIRTFIAEARYIPSSSMEQTLQINDRLMIEKVSYRFRKPQRKDIVVFRAPSSAAICTPGAEPPKEAYIKRIIGMPGDTVEFKDKKVFVNGQVLDEPYIIQNPDDKIISETLMPSRSVLLPNVGTQEESENINAIERLKINIPQDSYFVMGDNRGNSCDSRYWGFVPRENLIGRAFVRFWPVPRVGLLTDDPGPEPVEISPQASESPAIAPQAVPQGR